TNDAGTTGPVYQDGGGFTDVPPTDLPWTSPASISDGVPATFSSNTPCPTTRPDGTPIQGPVLIPVTLQTIAGTQQSFATVGNDGWTLTNSYNIGVRDLNATVTAQCVELQLPALQPTVLAQYTTNPIAVNP